MSPRTIKLAVAALFGLLAIAPVGAFDVLRG
jgi:hypothetical protein